jgi:hypothetical protein
MEGGGTGAHCMCSVPLCRRSSGLRYWTRSFLCTSPIKFRKLSVHRILCELAQVRRKWRNCTRRDSISSWSRLPISRFLGKAMAWRLASSGCSERSSSCSASA